jgi:hypothetical protein
MKKRDLDSFLNLYCEFLNIFVDFNNELSRNLAVKTFDGSIRFKILAAIFFQIFVDFDCEFFRNLAVETFDCNLSIHPAFSNIKLDLTHV